MINRDPNCSPSRSKYRERLIFHNLVEIHRAKLVAANLRCIIWARKSSSHVVHRQLSEVRAFVHDLSSSFGGRSCKLLRNVGESSRDIFASSLPFNFVEKIYSRNFCTDWLENKRVPLRKYPASARCALLLFHFVRFNRRGNLDFHQASSFQSTALRDFEDFQVRSHDGTLFL